MEILLELLLNFAKIGMFTFGGGYAMISLIEDTCVKKKGWISDEEMMNMTVIAESTPGPVAINCASFVGYKKKGLIGALVATIGMILPSFCIIFLISTMLDNFLEITVVANAFKGIKVAVGILILDVGVKMLLKMERNIIAVVILLLAIATMLIINVLAISVSVIVLMLASVLISMITYLASRLIGNGGDKNDLS